MGIIYILQVPKMLFLSIYFILSMLIAPVINPAKIKVGNKDVNKDFKQKSTLSKMIFVEYSTFVEYKIIPLWI